MKTKLQSRYQKLLDICEAAERGEVIEYESSWYGWTVDDDFDAVINSNLDYRVAKPKRGAK